MKPKLTLYSRKDCCLCAEMKQVIQQVAAKIALEIDEVDIDDSTQLRAQFADEVPVLCIDGRRAFKYRVTAKELERRLKKRSLRSSFRWFRE